MLSVLAVEACSSGSTLGDGLTSLAMYGFLGVFAWVLFR